MHGSDSFLQFPFIKCRNRKLCPRSFKHTTTKNSWIAIHPLYFKMLLRFNVDLSYLCSEIVHYFKMSVRSTNWDLPRHKWSAKRMLAGNCSHSLLQQEEIVCGCEAVSLSNGHLKLASSNTMHLHNAQSLIISLRQRIDLRQTPQIHKSNCYTLASVQVK